MLEGICSKERSAILNVCLKSKGLFMIYTKNFIVIIKII